MFSNRMKTTIKGAAGRSPIVYKFREFTSSSYLEPTEFFIIDATKSDASCQYYLEGIGNNQIG